MSESQWFIIPNLSEFTDKARAIVYNNFGVWQNKTKMDVLIDEIAEKEKEEFDKILSHKESLTIVKEIVRQERHKKLNKIRYMINDDLFAEIIHLLNERMVSNILNGLVQKGLVETAFDSETNDFIFWIDEQEENPETD